MNLKKELSTGGVVDRRQGNEVKKKALELIQEMLKQYPQFGGMERRFVVRIESSMNRATFAISLNQSEAGDTNQLIVRP